MFLTASEARPVERQQSENDQLVRESCSDLEASIGKVEDEAKQVITSPSLASLSDHDIASHASSEIGISSIQVPQNASSSNAGNSLDAMGEIANASLPKADSSNVGSIPLDIEVKREKVSLANNERMPNSAVRSTTPLLDLPLQAV